VGKFSYQVIGRQSAMNFNYDEEIVDEIETFKRRATDKTGLSDFGDPFFEAPLAAWINDLRTQNLGEFGQSLLRKLAYREGSGFVRADAWISV
jgi:hypothetical protein